MPDESKLPKWAQEKIKLLEMRLGEAREELGKLKNKDAPPEGQPYLGVGFHWDRGSALDLPVSETVRWNLGKRDFIEARFREGHVKIMASGRIHMLPSSSNCIDIGLEDQ